MHLRDLFTDEAELCRYRNLTGLLARFLCINVRQLWRMNPEIMNTK